MAAVSHNGQRGQTHGAQAPREIPGLLGPLVTREPTLAVGKRRDDELSEHLETCLSQCAKLNDAL